MKKMRIDFAAPSMARTLFHTLPLAWLLALAAAVLCVSAALTGWQMLERQRAFELQLRSAQVRASAPVATHVEAPLVRIPEAQGVAVNAAVLQLNLPWRALRDAIAEATPPAIALLALEPDAHRQALKMSAEARSSDEMVAYVEQLKHQGLFSAVSITRHEINELDPNKPIRFQLEAQWSAP
ncbi:MAG: PilN domain-containing protein [Pseudomonadota bacterium]